MVTTHDLALTHIAERLAPRAANVHFEDNFENGIIGFDYHMRPGVVQKSNALALMRAVGLDVPSDGNSQILGKTPVPRSAQDLE
jgi:DNA mismatch repair ATPase MutS